VVARVFSSSWPTQFDKLNMMFSKVRIGNSLCPFHLIPIIMDVTNSFPSALEDFTTIKHVLFIVKIPSNLSIFLVLIPPIAIPSWNHHIDNYVYEIFGFTNKYMERNSAVLIFHDDDLCVFKEIKSFLDTNGYQIQFKWVVINSLLWMNYRIKGKMVIPLLYGIYITYHSIELYWTNSYHSLSCRLD